MLTVAQGRIVHVHRHGRPSQREPWCVQTNQRIPFPEMFLFKCNVKMSGFNSIFSIFLVAVDRERHGLVPGPIIWLDSQLERLAGRGGQAVAVDNPLDGHDAFEQGFRPGRQPGT